MFCVWRTLFLVHIACTIMKGYPITTALITAPDTEGYVERHGTAMALAHRGTCRIWSNIITIGVNFLTTNKGHKFIDTTLVMSLYMYI